MSDLVVSSEAKKKDRELLVGGFGARIVLMALPKPYPISNWISDAAERRSKKIAKIDLGKKSEKIDFCNFQSLIDLNNAKRSGALN